VDMTLTEPWRIR